MNQLPQQTVKRIEEEAEAHQPGGYDWQKEKRISYISGATSEAQRNRELAEALEIILRNKFYPSVFQLIDKALKNYQQ